MKRSFTVRPKTKRPVKASFDFYNIPMLTANVMDALVTLISAMQSKHPEEEDMIERLEEMLTDLDNMPMYD